MRSCKGLKLKKRINKRKIRKRRNEKKWYFPFGARLSDKNIENINEELRKNKSVRSESNGSWKLVPKDSREVYRARRRRQATRRDSAQGPPRPTKRHGYRPKKLTKRRRGRSSSTIVTHSEAPSSRSRVSESSMSVCSECASEHNMDY